MEALLADGGEPLMQVGLAVLYGGAIGLEREARGRAAGLRTMILVCLGATVIMIVSASLPGLAPAGERDIVRFDPGRIAAGIVTGIGFLGGAVVVKLGDLVRGVTTAACIWFAAGLGIALGQRHYALATVATIVGLVVLWLLNYAERIISSPLYRVIRMRVETPQTQPALDAARELLKERELRLMDLTVQQRAQNQTTEVALHVRVRGKSFQGLEVVQSLMGLEGVRDVSWQAGP